MRRDEIIDVRAYVVEGRGSGGDYHDRDKGHWLTDTLIANPKDSAIGLGLVLFGLPVWFIWLRNERRGVQ